MAHDVLLTGGVPLNPASAVLETVAQELGDLVPRMPDGDQRGWIRAALEAFARNDALETDRREALIPNGPVAVPIFHLKTGLTAPELGELGPYGYAETAIESYVEFTRLRDAGVIAPGTRFQVTMPGPLTTTFVIELAPEQLIPLATEALGAEVQRLVAAVPAEDLAIQFDIAVEVEHEEYRRTPDAFDAPIHEHLTWTQEQMLDAVARVANGVPAEAELGFHLCSMWHHYQAGGQDNRVLVDIANGIHARLSRPINYIHIPTTPEHGEADFAQLRELKLDRETRLYLGLIHMSDGLDGALRRRAAAETVLPDFGVAHYCGLNGPFNYRSRLPEIFALHRDAATHAAE